MKYVTWSLALSLGLLAGHVASARTPVIREAPKLLAAGDVASCSSSGDEATARLLDTLPGPIAALGDLAYTNGTASEFANCYDPSWGRHKARTRPVPGNHEYNTTGAVPYYNYFGAAAGDPSRGYYSYQVGSWHVVALNSNCSAIGGCDRDSAQGAWLAEDLDMHPRSCTLAYWHHPRFSSNNHGDNPSTHDLWAILDEHDADVVLAGHDHAYERFAPQDADGNADPFGMRSFVVGTGGRSHYAFETVDANTEVQNDETDGVLELTLRPISYDWRFVPVAGQTFTDSGSAQCVAPICGMGPELALLPPAVFLRRGRRKDRA